MVTARCVSAETAVFRRLRVSGGRARRPLRVGVRERHVGRRVRVDVRLPPRRRVLADERRVCVPRLHRRALYRAVPVGNVRPARKRAIGDGPADGRSAHRVCSAHKRATVRRRWTAIMSTASARPLLTVSATRSSTRPRPLDRRRRHHALACVCVSFVDAEQTTTATTMTMAAAALSTQTLVIGGVALALLALALLLVLVVCCQRRRRKAANAALGHTVR